MVNHIISGRDMEDNRRQRRIPITTEAKVIKLNSTDRANVELINVSNYGASLMTTVPLKFNERIKVSITLKKKSHSLQTEEVPATVRYIERKIEGFLYGIQFNIKINDTGFPIFNQYLEHLKIHE
jgi:hypothetical protein